jgi:cobalt-zinc-cadmium efflux system outer membrane protein
MRILWLILLVPITFPILARRVAAQQEVPDLFTNRVLKDNLALSPAIPGYAIDQSVSDSLTLDQVVRHVVQRNDRVAAARFRSEAAERRINSAGVWDDPMLMLGVQNVPTNLDFNMEPMTMKMVGLSQNVPYAGYKGLDRNAARAEAGAALEDQRGTEVDMVATAKTAYCDVYYLQQTLKELQLQREILEQVVASSTAKLRTNQAGQDEVLGAQADVWRLENTILSTEQEKAAAGARLNSLCGEDPSRPLPPLAAPSACALPANVQAWLTEADQNYPHLARLKKQAESYGFLARANRRMVWPMLNLGASYGLRSGFQIGADGMEVKRGNMLSFQASISLPIFSRGKQHQMARSMDAMRRGMEAEANQLRRDVQADLITLYLRAQQLSQSLDSYRNRIIPATEDAFRSALAGYTANRTSFASLSSYSLSLYRDRIMADQLADELARTLIEADRYTKGTAGWEVITNANEKSK